MNLTRDGFSKQSNVWSNQQRKISRASQDADDKALDGLRHVNGIDHARWGAERGRPVDAVNFVAGVFDARKPLLCHLYFKAHTPAMRFVNVGADRAVGDAISEVLQNRYSPDSFKIEFYGRDAKLGMMCMALVIEEGMFCGGEEYTDETLRVLDDALGKLEG